MTDDDVLRQCAIASSMRATAWPGSGWHLGRGHHHEGKAAQPAVRPGRGSRSDRGDGAHAAARQRQPWRRQRHHHSQAGGLDSFRQARRQGQGDHPRSAQQAGLQRQLRADGVRPRSGSPARPRAGACTTRSLRATPSGCWTGSSRRTARRAARPCSPSTQRPSPPRSGSGSTSARTPPSADSTAAAASSSPPAGLSSRQRPLPLQHHGPGLIQRRRCSQRAW